MVWLLDAGTLDKVDALNLPKGDVPNDLSFSPDGHRLAVGGARGTLSVFDVHSGEPVHGSINLHDSYILQVEWLPDSRTVVTSSADGTIRLYDADRDLVEAVALPGSGDLEPSSDIEQSYTHLVPGTVNEIIALSSNRSGHRYPTEPSVWLDQACDIADRDLTQAEWDRYAPDRPYRRTCSDL